MLGAQIIQVNLTSENPRPVTPGTQLEFTYSVKWEATDIPFHKRFNRYLDYNFFEHQVGRGMGSTSSPMPSTTGVVRLLISGRAHPL